MTIELQATFSNSPKFKKVGPLGISIYVRSLCYSLQNNTNIFIPDSDIHLLLDGFDDLEIMGKPALDIDWPKYMVEAGLWEKERGGYLILNCLQ